ncbi:cytochrome P450 [Cristinia sonorae]|uniref:Cytochrome P450 n=1 Tax=Cristinia sonorae TaxID=1940300 RepID=A0A8K0UTX6_9AGAR|nr:cytochrome P450 [Cristinia sonorae]
MSCVFSWCSLSSATMSSSDLTFSSVAIGLAICLVVSKWLKSARDARKLSHIPSVTFDLPLLSYIGAFQFTIASGDLLQKGYNKYKGRPFKVPEFLRWHVLVSGNTLVQELRRAGDDELSVEEAVNAMLYLDHTFGLEVVSNMYQVPVTRIALTRNLGVLYPLMREELVLAHREYIPLSKEWIRVGVYNTIMKIVSRASNRIFVGLPLCRDPEFMQLNVDFTTEVIKVALLFGVVPTFMRGFATKLTSLDKLKKRAEELLRPLIEERLKMMEEYGDDWHGKPNDMLSWLIDASPKGEGQVQSVALRIVITNFGAIHTSSMTFSHVLYRIASSSQYQTELREEVENVVKQHGWTKASLDKMVKADSFIKECSRFYGVGSTSLTRIAVKDFTFSDGTFIPKGTMVSASSRAIHFDEENYENATAFDPWRYAELSKSGDTSSLRNQFVNTHYDFQLFGIGRHACPGRFFASLELKSMLADLVTTYDMKLERDGVIPSPTWVGATVIPHRTAAVMFRQRQS